MKKHRAFKQHGLTGLCGPYAIVNALALIAPGAIAGARGPELARRLAAALPMPLAAVMREGTDRAQMEAMLQEAAWVSRREGLAPWSAQPLHPVSGDTSKGFWDRVAGELGPGAAAVVGFGDHHRPSAYYEPHWTCLERVDGRVLHLLDSDEYDRIPRRDTGIRPEPGWEVEDCFVLRRESAWRVAGDGAGSISP